MESGRSGRINGCDWHVRRVRRNDFSGPTGVQSREQGIIRSGTVLEHQVPRLPPQFQYTLFSSSIPILEYLASSPYSREGRVWPQVISYQSTDSGPTCTLTHSYPYHTHHVSCTRPILGTTGSTDIVIGHLRPY
ncbi:hypothetical protein MG293_002991 [Ovis ammon polii]|uniref:Uncharacterized protein n=1 Tax=Ovis ammon polii TaxID=230172 RepID=A0AAD4UJK8_OVIAM|nr:hypothetical protein MG293_002991 [Ovis ammon polii]